MLAERYREKVQAMLAPADIRIDGNRPWDVRIINNEIYQRVVGHGMLGVGEGYMEGWWECDELDEMIARAYSIRVNRKISPAKDFFFHAYANLRNLQNRIRAYQVGRRHYDIGQDLYRAMLDRRMIYSCGYWKEATTLDEAQEHKLDLIARKLQLETGMRVLDIGCGWGGALNYLCERYGITGVGITISSDQQDAATQLCASMPIEIRLQDYRALNEKFDRIFSVGMLEHVGHKNYSTYMRVVRRCLDPGGLFLLHTIGGRRSGTRTDPWIDRYIFPNGMLPSAAQLTAAAEDTLTIEDWHNFPDDYWRTLMCWYQNFERAWGGLKANYDEQFFRMWRYYLLSSAGSFRAGGNQLWQIVFSRDGVTDGYAATNIR